LRSLAQARWDGSTRRRPVSVNILGDFNLAGEVWIIRDYFEKMGVQVSPPLPAMAASTTSAAPTAPLSTWSSVPVHDAPGPADGAEARYPL